MMHYCFLLITKELPSNDDISNILKPYYYERYYMAEEYDNTIKRPPFTWDWWEIGGRYNGKFKLKCNPMDADNQYAYNWGYYNSNRTGRLFRSSLLERMKQLEGTFFDEDKRFYSMGVHDGFLYVDGAKISDILNFDCTLCFGLIGLEDSVFVREKWNGSDWIKNESFDEKVEEYCKSRTNCFVTVLDIHN